MSKPMNFSRGDPNYHVFWLLASTWSAGGKLFFAAKPAFDDDNTDSTSVISGAWDDSALLTDGTLKGLTYKRFGCLFPPSATNSIKTVGAGTVEYLGEFEWVDKNNNPYSYPAYDEEKISVVLYTDIKRKIT